MSHWIVAVLLTLAAPAIGAMPVLMFRNELKRAALICTYGLACMSPIGFLMHNPAASVAVLTFTVLSGVLWWICRDDDDDEWWKRKRRRLAGLATKLPRPALSRFLPHARPA